MIAINDFKREPEALLEEELAAVRRVLESGWYILGPEVRSFEKKWAAYVGVPYAVGVGNGLDAIDIGFRALGIGSGAEVVTTAMSAFATVLGVMRAGATPVLADIDGETALMDPESARRCVTPRTRAIMPVHLYGQVRNLADWAALCADLGVALVEDCAQAHGAVEGGRAAGGLGEWGAYSFYPTKNLGALGDAGALTTNRADIAEAATSLRNYGQSDRYHHPLVGLNSRLDELHAALLTVRLDYLQSFISRRQDVAEAYHAGIANPQVRVLAPPTERSAHVYHLFVVCCNVRDRLQAHLASRGVQTLMHYPVPIHKQPPCREIGRDGDGLSRAERHAAECLSLPCHPQMSDEEVAAVISAINEFV
jgi:dTDP-4-amino-4,6-dideoxygalactose transaminase